MSDERTVLNQRIVPYVRRYNLDRLEAVLQKKNRLQRTNEYNTTD